MKKNTVYFMSLLALACIMNGVLRAAAAEPEVEEKVLAALDEARTFPVDRKIRFDTYTKVKEQYLDLLNKLEWCRINRYSDNNTFLVQDFYQKIRTKMTNSQHTRAAVDGLRERSGGSHPEDSRSYRQTLDHIQTLKKNIAQLKRKIWWAWITSFGKRQVNVPSIPLAKIGELTRLIKGGIYKIEGGRENRIEGLEKEYANCKAQPIIQVRNMDADIKEDEKKFPDNVLPHAFNDAINQINHTKIFMLKWHQAKLEYKKLKFEQYELELIWDELEGR